jgi:hypothetical protein
LSRSSYGADRQSIDCHLQARSWQHFRPQFKASMQGIEILASESMQSAIIVLLIDSENASP